MGIKRTINDRLSGSPDLPEGYPRKIQPSGPHRVGAQRLEISGSSALESGDLAVNRPPSQHIYTRGAQTASENRQLEFVALTPQPSIANGYRSRSASRSMSGSKLGSPTPSTGSGWEVAAPPNAAQYASHIEAADALMAMCDMGKQLANSPGPEPVVQLNSSLVDSPVWPRDVPDASLHLSSREAMGHVATSSRIDGAPVPIVDAKNAQCLETLRHLADALKIDMRQNQTAKPQQDQTSPQWAGFARPQLMVNKIYAATVVVDGQPVPMTLLLKKPRASAASNQSDSGWSGTACVRLDGYRFNASTKQLSAALPQESPSVYREKNQWQIEPKRFYQTATVVQMMIERRKKRLPKVPQPGWNEAAAEAWIHTQTSSSDVSPPAPDRGLFGLRVLGRECADGEA